MFALCSAPCCAFTARRDTPIRRTSRWIGLRARLTPAAPRQRHSSRAVVVKAASDANSTVKIVIQGLGGLTVTEPIRDYVNAKISRAIHNFEGAVKEVDVRLSVRGKSRSTEAHHLRHQIVEVTAYTLGHGVLRVEDEEDDAYAAVDLVSDKLKRKLTRLKEKATQRSNWRVRDADADWLQGMLLELQEEEEEGEEELPLVGEAPSLPPQIPQVVREKPVLLQPMAVGTAMEQLENLGHDFFLFADVADSRIKVLYRRRSHGYGVLVAHSTG